AAIIPLVVCCIWALFVVWMLLSIAGIADPPDSTLYVLLYWVRMLVGPLALIVGSALLLRGATRSGAALVAIGCLLLTVFTIYNGIVGMQRAPLEAPPLYSVHVVSLLIMFLADLAAYKIFRALVSS